MKRRGFFSCCLDDHAVGDSHGMRCEESEAELDAMKFNIESHFAQEDDILKSTFDKYDANGDGTLDHSEILKFVADMSNGELTQTDVEKYISVIDFNGSGDVTFPEFKEWWESNDAAFTTVHIAAEVAARPPPPRPRPPRPTLAAGGQPG